MIQLPEKWQPPRIGQIWNVIQFSCAKCMWMVQKSKRWNSKKFEIWINDQFFDENILFVHPATSGKFIECWAPAITHIELHYSSNKKAWYIDVSTWFFGTQSHTVDTFSLFYGGFCYNTTIQYKMCHAVISQKIVIWILLPAADNVFYHQSFFPRNSRIGFGANGNAFYR